MKEFKYYSKSRNQLLVVEMAIERKHSGIDWEIHNIHNGQYKMGAETYFKLPKSEQDLIDKKGDLLVALYGQEIFLEFV